MHDSGDTIAAVSSSALTGRVIIRLSGDQAIDICSSVLDAPIQPKPGIACRNAKIAKGVYVKALVYVFIAPKSYTGQNCVEIHIESNPPVTQAFLECLFTAGAVQAQPGQFTARAYLNGKIDLSQAEAVNEIISGSNHYQLDAAQKLLAGRLSKRTEQLANDILDCLSLLEAGLDFSHEDIEFITNDQAARKLQVIQENLKDMLKGPISYETLIELPSVGIIGASNAGKSSLLNTLLGKQRSIVSHECHTTRDVLTARLSLKNTECILFDCAGVTVEPVSTLEELARRAVYDAIAHAEFVLFCVDMNKSDWSEDLTIWKIVSRAVNESSIQALATKADIAKDQNKYLGKLCKLFKVQFTAVSSKTSVGIEKLRKTLDARLLEKAGMKNTGQNIITDAPDPSLVNIRHRQTITHAIENIDHAIDQLRSGSEDIAAMLLRAAWQGASMIERESFDEQVLDAIFGKFCIGK